MTTQETRLALQRLIKQGDLTGIREIIEQDPSVAQVKTGATGATMLHYAAEQGMSQLVRYFHELGLPLDTTDTFDTPLACMVGQDDLEMVEWMLANGADAGFTQWPVIRAASRGHLRMIRLLVEYKADVNFVFGSPPRTPLSQATARGHQEVADYLKSLGAIMPPAEEEAATGEISLFDATAEELRQYFKYHTNFEPNTSALQEIVPGVVRIAVSTIETGANKIIYTTGMSTKPMSVPDGYDGLQYAELVMYLPKEWPTIESADNPQAWPWRWLRTMAHYAHENDTWLGGPLSTFASDEPPGPLAPTTDFTAFLLSYNHGFKDFVTDEGRHLNMITVVPIYTAELRLAQQADGFRKLGQGFDQHNIGAGLHPNRINVGLK